jgi:RNA polymerase sigma factor (sigma-70 family)
MQQVRGGRTAALATLFERHHARVYGYCLRMTGNRSAAEDLVQDVFMKMLKYKATFKDDSELVPWMFGIARNSCLGHLKRRANDHLPAAPPAEEAAADDAHDERDDRESEPCGGRCCACQPATPVLVLSRSNTRATTRSRACSIAPSAPSRCARIAR